MSLKLIIILVLYVCATLSGVAHSIYEREDIYAQEDTTFYSIELRDIEIGVQRQLPILDTQDKPGNFRIGSAALKTVPNLFGTPDPIRLMQSLPAVSSSDCISGGMYVQGSENAHNLVTIDGIEVYNPMHLLGLFSIFNAPHFESYDIKFRPDLALASNFVGAEISANTPWSHPQYFGGDFTVGIIDSHGSIKIPLARDLSSLQLSGRATYVNALFGDAIKVENAPLKYGFQDFNLSYLQSFAKGWMLKFNAYYGRDNMDVSDPNYSSDIVLGWRNLAIGANVCNSSGQMHTIGYSQFDNKAVIKYASLDKSMPSDIKSISYKGQFKAGAFNIAASTSYRHLSPQHSKEYIADTLFATNAIESYIGADLPIAIGSNIRVLPGLKMAYYHAVDINLLYPLPSISMRCDLPFRAYIDVSVGRRVQFVHKIEESTIGFPTDFWISADRHNPPLEAMDYSFSLQGALFNGKANYSIGAYYKSFRNLTDWIGNLFSMLDSDYEPLWDVANGDGRSVGVSAMLLGRFGPIKGWISYTLSKSQHKFTSVSNKWFPYSHDRTHDLKLNLLWSIRHNLALSATFVYASGNPYTEPLYGYMIGENLILEFKEHNSSRLPSMHRLDLGLNWTFYSSGSIVQSLNLSLFNAYKHNNVMFKSFTYSPDQGITPTQWSMDYVLPSVSYNIKF